jgi:hypothetical protein
MRLVQTLKHLRQQSEDSPNGSVNGDLEFGRRPSGKQTKHVNSNTNFDRITETPTPFTGIDVSLYKSRETGLKVLIANVEMPIVPLAYFHSL